MGSQLHATLLTNLRRSLQESGITQRRLAERMGCTEAHVSTILSGRYVPRLELIERIAKALDVDPHELLSPEKIAAA